jgi:hypothetical protein
VIETTLKAERLELFFYDTLVERLEEQAMWREAKAEECLEDSRNRNSAEALWTGARIVGQFEPHDLPAVRSFVEFARVLEGEDGFDDPTELVRGSFVASRFHFDTQRRDVTYAEVVDCLNDMFRQSVKACRDGLDIEVAVPELLMSFDTFGVPLEGAREK